MNTPELDIKKPEKPTSVKISGAEAVIRCLIEEGVTSAGQIAGIAGSVNWDYCACGEISKGNINENDLSHFNFSEIGGAPAPTEPTTLPPTCSCCVDSILVEGSFVSGKFEKSQRIFKTFNLVQNFSTSGSIKSRLL